MQHLITTLQSAQAKLVADISMYDTMYTQNAQQYRELKMTVLAGKKALADFNANQLPALEAEAAASGDAMQAQVLKNFKSKLDRFAKRLDDLDRISVVTLHDRAADQNHPERGPDHRGQDRHHHLHHDSGVEESDGDRAGPVQPAQGSRPAEQGPTM